MTKMDNLPSDNARMTPELWANIRHFRPDSDIDNFGNPGLMNVELIYKLDLLRDRRGKPLIITEGYAIDGHSDNSQHYEGRGVDCHSVGDLLDFYLAAEREGFTGIGVYSWGLHLDNRPGPAGRWARINGVMGPLNAVALDFLRARYKYKN